MVPFDDFTQNGQIYKERSRQIAVSYRAVIQIIFKGLYLNIRRVTWKVDVKLEFGSF